MKVEKVTYGEGGFDPAKPDGNVISRDLVEVDEPDPEGDVDLAPVRAKVAKITNAATREALSALLDVLA